MDNITRGTNYVREGPLVVLGRWSVVSILGPVNIKKVEYMCNERTHPLLHPF